MAERSSTQKMLSSINAFRALARTGISSMGVSGLTRIGVSSLCLPFGRQLKVVKANGVFPEIMCWRSAIAWFRLASKMAPRRAPRHAISSSSGNCARAGTRHMGAIHQREQALQQI